jgi:hypothetical protein
MTDIDDTPPTLGTCDLCGWQFMFPTVFAKEKGVDKHHERWHGDLASQTDEVCDRLWIERGDERAKVVKAVEAVALLNGGDVDWNTVRGLIDGEVSSGVYCNARAGWCSCARCSRQIARAVTPTRSRGSTSSSLTTGARRHDPHRAGLDRHGRRHHHCRAPTPPDPGACC